MSSPAHPPKDGAGRYASGRHPVVHSPNRARPTASNDRNNSALALLVRFREANVNTKTVRDLFQILDFECRQGGSTEGASETEQENGTVTLGG